MRRLIGRLGAAALLLTYAGMAAAGCDRDDFVLAIDIGHSARSPGATSAHGVPEYLYNKRLAHRLLETARAEGYTHAFLINDDDAVHVRLSQRSALARKQDADLLLSIHHDSMRASLLQPWTFQGVALRYGDQYRGHSLFYSERNREAQDSRWFAELAGEALRAAGLTPTHHHDGVGQRRLVNAELGVYRFDPLILLHTAKMPAVLFEAGVILNREEELLLADSRHQDLLIGALLQAVTRYCAAS